MTQFQPFRPLRYTRHDLSSVLAPPYDVLSAADRTALLTADEHNSVAVDFPPGREDPAAYEGVARLLSEWIGKGTLAWGINESFTIIRMTAPAAQGVAGRTTTGVVGALALSDPRTGDILPHEQTTTKDKADRLTLIRAARINTSPIWGLSMSKGLGALLSRLIENRPADGQGTDREGVLHQLWEIDDATAITSIRSLVDAAPVVLADGHHRFETALAYQDERRASMGDQGAPSGADTGLFGGANAIGLGGADAIMTMIVELAPDELEVRPIHRLVDLPVDASAESLLESLSPWFTIDAAPDSTYNALAKGGTAADNVVHALPGQGALLLVLPTNCWFLSPRHDVFGPTITLDSERVREAMSEGVPTAQLRFHHDAANIYSEVLAHRAAAGLLLRPATVAQIHEVADKRTRMPAKTTFFWPKPRTGMVFRSVE